MARRNRIQRTDVYLPGKFDLGEGHLSPASPADAFLNFYIVLECGTKIRVYKAEPERNMGNQMSIEIEDADKLIKQLDEKMREERKRY
jgi:hypothetical protein